MIQPWEEWAVTTCAAIPAADVFDKRPRSSSRCTRLRGYVVSAWATVPQLYLSPECGSMDQLAHIVFLIGITTLSRPHASQAQLAGVLFELPSRSCR